MFRHFTCVFFLAAWTLHGYTTFDGKQVPPLAAPANVVNVGNVIQLRQALINQASGQTIVIAAGTYNVGGYEPLMIDVDNLTIRGAGEDNSSVVFVGNGFGDGADSCANGEEMIKINARAFTIANLTLSEVRANCLKIQSGGNDNCLVHNVRFLNIGERMIKGPGVAISHNWEIRYCHFEDTKIPAVNRCNDIAGGNYIAGMDLMRCENFNIHDNVFMNIRGATGDGRGAVFIWGGAAGYDCATMNTFRNTFIGNDKAICYWDRVNGGVVKNNMIVAGANLGARIDGSNSIKLYNNTSFTSGIGSGAFTFNGSTNCEVKNNIILGGISVLSGAMPDTAHNITITRSNRLTAARWFGDQSAGNLHIMSDTCSPVNNGLMLSEVTDDWDGLARTDGEPDIGADEFSNNPAGLAAFANLPEKDVFLANAEPNPFNPSTLIRYFVPSNLLGVPLRLEIITLNGKHVRTLKQGVALPGSFSVQWHADADNRQTVASGSYVVRLQAGQFVKTSIVTCIK